MSLPSFPSPLVYGICPSLFVKSESCPTRLFLKFSYLWRCLFHFARQLWSVLNSSALRTLTHSLSFYSLPDCALFPHRFLDLSVRWRKMHRVPSGDCIEGYSDPASSKFYLCCTVKSLCVADFNGRPCSSSLMQADAETLNMSHLFQLSMGIHTQRSPPTMT